MARGWSTARSRPSAPRASATTRSWPHAYGRAAHAAPRRRARRSPPRLDRQGGAQEGGPVSRADPLDALELSLRSGAAELHLVRHADAVPEGSAPNGGAYGDYDDAPAQRARPRAGRGRRRALRRARHRGGVREPHPARARDGAGDRGPRSACRCSPSRTCARSRSARWSTRATCASSSRRWRRSRCATARGAASPAPSRRETVRARMLDAFDRIAAEHPGGRVVVVSHAGAINAAIGAIAGTPHDFVFPLANASISVVRVNAGRRLLVSANETVAPARHPLAQPAMIAPGARDDRGPRRGAARHGAARTVPARAPARRRRARWRSRSSAAATRT